MRITLEGTESESGRTVSVAAAIDSLTIEELRDELLIPLLLAWGYQPANVGELFGDYEETVEAERRPYKNGKKGVS